MTFVSAGTWVNEESSITARQLMHLRQNVSRGLDGANGGKYLPIGSIDITDGSGGALGDVDVHGRIRFRGGTAPRITYKYGTLTNANNQTFGIGSGGQILRFDPGGLLTLQHEITATGATKGDWILFVRDSTGANPLEIYNEDTPPYQASNLIVTMALGLHSCAKLFFDGALWHLDNYSPNATPGAAA